MYALSRSESRLFPTISRSIRRFSSTGITESPKEPIISPAIASESSREPISSASIIGDHPLPPPQSGPPPPDSAVGVEKNSWSFLKYGLIASLTGGVAFAGYATYAYPLDEVDKKTKTFRESAKFTIENNATSFDKFQVYLRAAAMTVPAKLVDIYIDLRNLAEDHVRGFTEPTSDKLLPDLHPLEQHVFTLVLDLNKTLVYSDWKRDRGWRTFKRPGVDIFLEHLAQFYEIVVYSDELSMYVDPVIERLDTKHCIRYRLARGATKYTDGKHYRDLSMLNRDPAKILYISGHALESCLQHSNCVPIKEWQGEANDTALLDLIPFLEYVAKHRPSDIRTVLASYEGCDIAKEFIERSIDHQRKMQEQKQQNRFWRR